MKVMTFNLRFDNDGDKEKAWPHRRELVVELIRKYEPDILGTQEGMMLPLRYLRDNLEDYSIADRGRVWDLTCQYPTLFYRHDALELVENGEFWLSRHPAIHRDKDWDSAFPRMASHALFVHKATSTRFVAAVTHLDHMGKVARPRQARILADWAKERQEPVIVMGDFNDVADSDTHTAMMRPESCLRDVWLLLEHGEGEEDNTHHDFAGQPNAGRLDWVLVNGGFEPVSCEIIRDHWDDAYPSDHFPVLAELKWA